MSSYFDHAQSTIRNDFQSISTVEAQIKKDVLLVIGDQEFPDDLRQKILGIIATQQYDSPVGPPTKGHQISEMMRYSELIDQLHSAFHNVARKQIKTRFGILSDKPNGILALRDAYLEDSK